MRLQQAGHCWPCLQHRAVKRHSVCRQGSAVDFRDLYIYSCLLIRNVRNRATSRKPEDSLRNNAELALCSHVRSVVQLAEEGFLILTQADRTSLRVSSPRRGCCTLCAIPAARPKLSAAARPLSFACSEQQTDQQQQKEAAVVARVAAPPSTASASGSRSPPGEVRPTAVRCPSSAWPPTLASVRPAQCRSASLSQTMMR